jgi:hypothetical protein
MILTGKNRRILITNCFCTDLSTTDVTLFVLSANPGLRYEKPANNRLSYCTVYTQHNAAEGIVHFTTVLTINNVISQLSYT